MSVINVAEFQGDTATFRQSLTERVSEFEKWRELARAAGGIHHRFGNPELQAFVGSIGAAPAPPEMIIRRGGRLA
jgi:hypothetical protein